MDLYLLVIVFFTVSLEDWGIRVIYIRPYGGSLDLIIMALVIVALVIAILVGVFVK